MSTRLTGVEIDAVEIKVVSLARKGTTTLLSRRLSLQQRVLENVNPCAGSLGSRDLVDGEVDGESVVIKAWQLGGWLAGGFELDLPAGPC